MRQFCGSARYVWNRALAIENEEREETGRFLCVNRGFRGHADDVSAINILSRGIEVQRDEGEDTAEASAGCDGAVRPSAAETRRGEGLPCASR